MEDKNKGKKLKNIKLEDLEFMANGKKYFIEPEISAERFAKMQEFEIELGFGVSYKAMFEGLGEAYELLNAGRNADAAVHIHQIREGISGLESRDYPILQYCACMINTEDEDRRVWSEHVMNEKIKDWMEEGIDYKCFFPLAINTVRLLKQNYVKFTQDISKNEE